MKLQWLFWPVLAFALAAVLFQVKQAARSMERELARTRANIEATEQSIEVLRAEWSHLNRPDYLQDLASRHLGFDPAQKTRIITLSDLPPRSRSQGSALSSGSLGRSGEPAASRSAFHGGAAAAAADNAASQPASGDSNGSFRHVSDIDLIGSMISNDLSGQ